MISLRTVTAACASLAAVATFCVAGAATAQAASGVGICDSSLSNGECWRNAPPSGGTDLWARDIAGDPYQQFTTYYLGTVSQLGCLNGVNLGGDFANTGVYAFSDGPYLVGAGYQEYLGADTGSNAAYHEWVWTSSGFLINCGQSQHWGQLQALCRVPEYNQLYVRGSGACTWDTWATVNPA